MSIAIFVKLNKQVRLDNEGLSSICIVICTVMLAMQVNKTLINNILAVFN